MLNMHQVENAAAIISAKRRFQIMCCLAAGQSKFNEIKRDCGNVSATELARSLKFLEKKGLIQKITYASTAKQTKYELTKKGKGFSNVLNAINKWGAEIQ